MGSELIWIILLSMLPIAELRVGLPLGIIYATQQGIPSILIILLSIISNILAIFVAFYFLDHLHKFFMKFSWYKKIFEKALKKLQKKIDKFRNSYSSWGMIALAIFVAIPLPGTGAWTACLISWVLGLERKKSVISIAVGVIGAGVIVSLASLGIINLLV